MERIDWDNVAKKGGHYLSASLLGKSKKRGIITLIKKWDDNKRKKTVLTTDLFEEAVGSHGIISWLKGRYEKVVGMDISFEMVKRACCNNSLSGDSIGIVSDVRQTTFKDNCFDLIISNSTIDHFSDLDLALRELYRILKSPGVLILTLHNKFHFALSLKMWLSRATNIKSYSYGYVYSSRQLKPRLEKIGFIVDATNWVYFFPPLCNFVISHIPLGAQRICKKIVRTYEKRISNVRYLKQFAGSNIAMRLLKNKH